jgi:hypothetical protein
MMPWILFFFGKSLSVAVLGYVKFTSNDWFYLQRAIFVIRIYSVFVGFGHKLENSEHVSMVRNGDGRHVVGYCLFIKRRYAGSTIKE